MSRAENIVKEFVEECSIEGFPVIATSKLMENYAQSQLQELREKVEDRISDIRDDLYEIEDKMNRYRFSEKEKKEGSTYYGGLQERESKYKKQIGELKFVLNLIDQLQED